MVHDSVVTAFVQKELPATEKGAGEHSQVAQAGGCIGKLLASPVGSADAAAAAFLAASGSDAAARFGQALRQTPFQARGGFAAMLDALLERLRDETRTGGDTAKLVEAIAQVAEARIATQGNVNPQLLAAVLSDALAGVGRKR